MARDEDEPSSDGRARATTIVVETVTGAVGSMAGGAIGGPAGAVVGALAGPAATYAGEALSRWVAGTQKSRRQKFLSRLTGETSEERQHEALMQMLGSKGEDFTSAVLAGIRAALDVLSVGAIPVLADLLKQYFHKAPDAFFRGVAEVLRAVSDGELRQIRLLAGALARALGEGPGPEWVRITVRVKREREGAPPSFLTIIFQLGTSTKTLEVGRIDDEAAFEAAIRLLKVNGILAETGSAFSPRNFAIYRRTAVRLADLLGHDASAPPDGQAT
jgi:hypothetical protein